ncbi:MAG: Hsp20/alpha crystallin family protein [Sulfolobales archaeon]|nr:Hsp20/alpha crystallin family protein [Sulfolobales archaeon]MCG2893575.1 Hsp20/alpha crystallin family protein [Sulfolobales archaeon]MCG2910029.1 Hsp20/alpha crystallin family protein [Sulfolobales archaeon]
MPVFRDLEEMIKLLSKRIEKRIEEEISSEFRRLFPEYERPLYSIIDHGGWYEIVIDLPLSDPNTLKVSIINNTLYVSAERTQGRTYYVKLSLPTEVDPKSMTVNRVKNFVRIKIEKIIKET